MKALKLEKTSRGFAYGKFVDKYGQECSLQKSSRVANGLGDECIWFGIDNNSGKFSVCHRNGTGWKEHHIGEFFPNCDVLIPDRMHLTQDMVKALLPALQHFAKTGELPDTTPKAVKKSKKSNVKVIAYPEHGKVKIAFEPALVNTYIPERLKEICNEQFGTPVNIITNESDGGFFGADSLDAVEMAMAVEEEFGIEIPDEDAEQLERSNFGKLVEYVQSKVSKLSLNDSDDNDDFESSYLKGMKDGTKDRLQHNDAKYLSGDWAGADTASHKKYIEGYVYGFFY